MKNNFKNPENYCPHCNAKLKGRWENITKGQLNMLAKFREAITVKNENSIHLQSDVNFSKNEYANFQKLRYSGLVAKCEVSAYWLLTKRGAAFLRNEIFLPKGVLVFRNRIQKYHEDKVNLMAVLKNNEPYWYKREDYVWETVDIIDFEIDAYDWIDFDKKGQGFLKL